MSLMELHIKTEYRSLIDNMVEDFYVPLLEDATIYKRAVGFFSSTALVEISKGIANLAKNGGKIQIVASPYLSDDDILAIKKGYKERNSVIEGALLKQLDDKNLNYFESERLNLLANLISDGILDIRIAYTEDKNGIGMYHEKMGIIEDNQGNKVAFSGSMNESSTAMFVNYETIDVFRSWVSDSENSRVKLKERAFSSIWNDSEPNVHVLEFPKITETLIEKFKRKNPNYNIDREQYQNKSSIKTNKLNEPKIPDSIDLYDYQKEAIKNWEKHNYCGIFDMATGTGKTLTGLGAVTKLSEKLNNQLAVIIVCPYQHLVEQWVEDIEKFNMIPIIGYGASSQKNWRKSLEKAIRDQKIRQDKKFFCLICTNATFSKEYVQMQINKIKSPILLLIDEAHNFGAKSLSKNLDERFQYRLALSATLDRHGDEEGTKILYDYFGNKCIEYTLERAIKEKKLTPYKYFPVLVNLNEEELAKYDLLSKDISKHVIKGRNGKMKLDSYGEILAIKRSRIVAAASEKLSVIRELMEPYKDEHFILVYCGATNVMMDNSEQSSTNESDIRQIEAVTKILGNELKMKVSKFTSNEKIDERESIKSHFKYGDDLQAIVAIKCLDEGVNIPSIKTAFILASSTNPKEYVQRRGRVLRKSPETGKTFAEIYDFVTLPRPLEDVPGLTKSQMNRDLSLVRKELVRVKEFGDLSLNKMSYLDLFWDVCDAYHINYDLSEDTTEDDDYGR